MNLAGRPIDADPRAHLDGVPLDARLELLIAIVGEPDRATGKAHRRQRDVERERRMVASAESAADMREMRVDARRLEGVASFTQKECDRVRGLVRRLHAEHELEVLAAPVVPGETAFRLEEHRVHGLRLEFAVQHQEGRIVRRKLGADLLAVGGGFGIFAPGRYRERRPYRALRILETPRTDPSFLSRRVDIRRVRCRAGDTRETIGAIGGHRDRTGLLAEFQERPVTQREPRLIEGVELFEDQQSNRLAEIQWRPADRAEQVAGVELGNAGADALEIGRSHHHRRLQRATQAREIDARVDVRGVCGPDKHGVGRLRGPARKVSGTEIGCVQLGPCDLGNTVNATGAGGGRVPASVVRAASRALRIRVAEQIPNATG